MLFGQRGLIQALCGAPDVEGDQTMASACGCNSVYAVALRLRTMSIRGGVVELPAIPEQYSNQLYMLRAADHGRPLVNAASSFTSPLTQKIYTMTEGPAIPKEFLDLLEGIPTSYVVFHHGRLTTEREDGFDKFLAASAAQGRLRLIGRYGEARSICSCED